jgi:hypothetical protein
MGLKRGPIGLVSIIKELLRRKSSGLENRDYGRRGSAALNTRPLLVREVSANFCGVRGVA